MSYYPIIDGDVLLYRCGFAAQYNEYCVLDENDEVITRFRYKKELDEFLEYHGLEKWDVSTVIEPLGYAINNLYTTLVFILDRLQAPDYIIYLSGEGNFREEVAKTRVYKGNRDPHHKPAHYEDMKQYLIDTWKAEVVNGIEADDAIAEQHKWKLGFPEETQDKLGPPCIVTTDKDLDQIHGWHYNWVKDELFYIEEIDADRYFWVQMIQGDSTDNIQGIPGMGEKKAEKYLSQFDAHEWEEAVKDLYYEHYTLGKEVFDEHYQLIKIGGDNNNDKKSSDEVRTD